MSTGFFEEYSGPVSLSYGVFKHTPIWSVKAEVLLRRPRARIPREARVVLAGLSPSIMHYSCNLICPMLCNPTSYAYACRSSDKQ